MRTFWLAAAIAVFMLLTGCDVEQPSSPSGPQAPIGGPIVFTPEDPGPGTFQVIYTTHGDSIYVPLYVSAPVGGSAYHKSRIVLTATSPDVGVVIGQPASWCGPIATVVGLGTPESLRGRLGLSDTFTEWYADACSLNAMILQAPGKYDVWTVIDGHEVGESAFRWQLDYLDVPPCVERENSFCIDFLVTIDVLP